MTIPPPPPASPAPAGPDQPPYPPATPPPVGRTPAPRPGDPMPGTYRPPAYPPAPGYPPPAHPVAPSPPAGPRAPSPVVPTPPLASPVVPTPSPSSRPATTRPAATRPMGDRPPSGRPAQPGLSRPSGPGRHRRPSRLRKAVRRTLVALPPLVVVIAVGAAVKFGGAASLTALLGPSAPVDPFAGTAAESLPHGEAGIVVPTAAAVPGFTDAEVAAALETVRQALIAGRLDERMLYEHDRSALRALFSPTGAKDLDQLFENDLGGIVATMIAPGHTLADHPIRVSGTMSFTGVVIADIRWLEVRTAFVWVYPFPGPSQQPGDRLVTLKDEIYWLFPATEDVLPEDAGMYLDGRSTSFAHNIDCDLLERSLIALGRAPADGAGAEIDPHVLLDPTSTVSHPETC